MGNALAKHWTLLTYLAVEYKVTGPSPEPGKERVIMEGEKERQGDFVFTATQTGEYRFCFDNSVSTFSDKLVDFEITVHRGTTQSGHCDVNRADGISRSRTKPALTCHKKPAPRRNNSAASRRPCSNSPARSRP